MHNLNKNLKPEITATSFAFRIRDALEGLNIDPKPFEGKIHKAATKLWKKSVEWAGELSASQLNGSFLDFSFKAQTNLAFLGPFGVSAKAWFIAALNQPPLFGLEPRLIKAHFEENVKWLKKYGVTPERWAKACLRQPTLFELKGSTLEAIFDANYEWLKKYKISRKDWLQAALAYPSLFYQDPLTLRTNFQTNLVWAKTYGISQKKWRQEALKRPSRFYQDPKTLRLLFELLFAFTVAPHFRLSRNVNVSAFRQQRIKYLFDRGYYSLDNLLLRMAFAEIVAPSPSSALLKLSRDKIETDLVNALGYHRASKILPYAMRGTLESQKYEKLLLKKKLKECAEAIAADIRANPKPKEPRPIARSVLGFLLPEYGGPLSKASPTDKIRLLESLVQGGLLKGYRFRALRNDPGLIFI